MDIEQTKQNQQAEEYRLSTDTLQCLGTQKQGLIECNVNDLTKSMFIENFIWQSFSLDYYIFSTYLQEDYSKRPCYSQTQLDNIDARKIFTQLQIAYEIPRDIIQQSALYYTQYFNKSQEQLQEILPKHFIEILQKIQNQPQCTLMLYKFIKLVIFYISTVLSPEQFELKDKLKILIAQLQQQYTLQELLSEQVQLEIMPVLITIKSQLAEIIMLCPTASLQPLEMRSRVNYQIINGILFNNCENKLKLDNMENVDLIVKYFSQIQGCQPTVVQKDFFIQWLNLHNGFQSIQEGDVLLYFMEKLELNSETPIIKQFCDQIIDNYFTCFQNTVERFEFGLILLKKSLQLQNFNIVIEKMLINCLMKQVNQYKNQYQLKFDQSIADNMKMFIEFLLCLERQIKCQLQVFIPIMTRFTQGQYYVLPECRISESQIVNTQTQVRPSLKEYSVPGGYSASFSTVQSGKHYLLPVSPYTIYTSVCIKLIIDMVKTFQANWNISNGFLEKIQLGQLKICSEKIQNIAEILYSNLKQSIIQNQDNTDPKLKLETLHWFFPKDLVLQVCSPIICQSLVAEYDCLVNIVDKVIKNEQIIEYDPFEGNQKYQQQHVLKSSSIVEDLFLFIDQIFTELVSQMQLSKSCFTKLMEGMNQIVIKVIDSFMLRTDVHVLPKIVSVFAEHTDQENTLQYQPNYEDGLSSFSLSKQLITAQDSKQINQYFAQYICSQESISKFLYEKPKQLVQINPYQSPISLLMIYQFTQQMTYRLNALDKLFQRVSTIQNIISRAQFDESIDEPIKIVKQVQNKQPKENDDTKIYFTNIFRNIEECACAIMKFVSQFTINAGFRFLFQQLYCPSINFCRIDELYNNLKQQMMFSMHNLTPRYRKPLFQIYMGNVTACMRYVLLDSGTRARTIVEKDGQQLIQDVQKLKELLTDKDFMIDQIYQKYSGEQTLLKEEEIEDIFRRLDRVVDIHCQPSSYLIQYIQGLKKTDFAKLDVSKSLECMRGPEEFVRVLNFRRQADEVVQEFMENLEKK